jgi:DNA-binding NtrC family response regulator
MKTMKDKRVLIVDDEPPYRVFLRKLFEKHGCRVETSASGIVSREIADRMMPDVLVIDWMLKNTVDGLQAAAEIRKHNPDLVTILITGYPSVELEERTKSEPRTTFVSKPFEAEDILSAVRSALAKKGKD